MTVSDNGSRWEIEVDGAVVGFADHHRVGDVIVMPHTVIDPSMRGRGLAAILVRHALDDVRASGCTVDPQCWYVAQFIDENLEYADLRAG